MRPPIYTPYTETKPEFRPSTSVRAITGMAVVMYRFAANLADRFYLDRYNRTIGKRLFERTVKDVAATPPLEMRDCGLLYMTMLCHRDVHPYLVAIKSLYVQVGMGRVLVVNDGSLLPSDVHLLRHHIPLIKFVHIRSIDTGRCPRGGTWERLVKILELTASYFVIQIDADTLTSGPVPEIVKNFRENRSFLLGTRASQKISTAPDVAKMVRGWIDANRWTSYSVGVAAEAAIDSLPHAHRFNYAHASSGFAGFARGAFDFAMLEDFSIQMRERLGARWDEWGTEQIASNFMVANAPNATVLPFDRYACFEPHIPVAGRPFLHFIGAYRYHGGLYRKRIRAFLNTASSTIVGQYGRKALYDGTVTADWSAGARSGARAGAVLGRNQTRSTDRRVGEHSRVR